MYQIWGKYRNTPWELLDEFDIREVAANALVDYRMAFGTTWTIKIKKEEIKNERLYLTPTFSDYVDVTYCEHCKVWIDESQKQNVHNINCPNGSCVTEDIDEYNDVELAKEYPPYTR